MKKLLFALLMAALLVAVFVACTEPEITTPDVTTTTPADSTTPDAAVTTTDGVVTTTTNPDTTTTPADSTTAAPGTTEEPQGPVTPTEKTLVLGPEDFSNCTAIAMNGVVPNTDHPNEFTFSKNGACMASGITGVTKVVAHVFGTYDNLKMYKGLSTDGTEIKVNRGLAERRPQINMLKKKRPGSKAFHHRSNGNDRHDQRPRANNNQYGANRKKTREK